MRHITSEFLFSIVPICALFLVIVVMFCGLFCSKSNDSECQDDQEWEGFVESFFLVIKDILTCCSKNDNKGERLVAPSEPKRQRRASSVNRQTDSLKRLARDVTPRLQIPYDVQSVQSHVNALGDFSHNGTLNRASTVPPQPPQIQHPSVVDLLHEPDLRPAPPPYLGATSTSPIQSNHNHDGLYLVQITQKIVIVLIIQTNTDSPN